MKFLKHCLLLTWIFAEGVMSRGMGVDSEGMSRDEHLDHNVFSDLSQYLETQGLLAQQDADDSMTSGEDSGGSIDSMASLSPEELYGRSRWWNRSPMEVQKRGGQPGSNLRIMKKSNSNLPVSMKSLRLMKRVKPIARDDSRADVENMHSRKRTQGIYSDVLRVMRKREVNPDPEESLRIMKKNQGHQGRQQQLRRVMKKDHQSNEQEDHQSNQKALRIMKKNDRNGQEDDHQTNQKQLRIMKKDNRNNQDADKQSNQKQLRIMKKSDQSDDDQQNEGDGQLRIMKKNDPKSLRILKKEELLLSEDAADDVDVEDEDEVASQQQEESFQCNN